MNEQLRIEEIIAEHGKYISTTSGVSMKPMIRNRQDTIFVEPVEGRLEKYDVALFRRGDKYVLHRVIKVLPNSYITRGDNCITSEKNVRESDIIGKLTGFNRGGKEIDLNSRAYKFYSVMICASHPLVVLKIRAVGAFKRLRSKLTK